MIDVYVEVRDQTLTAMCVDVGRLIERLNIEVEVTATSLSKLVDIDHKTEFLCIRGAEADIAAIRLATDWELLNHHQARERHELRMHEREVETEKMRLHYQMLKLQMEMEKQTQYEEDNRYFRQKIMDAMRIPDDLLRQIRDED